MAPVQELLKMGKNGTLAEPIPGIFSPLKSYPHLTYFPTLLNCLRFVPSRKSYTVVY